MDSQSKSDGELAAKARAGSMEAFEEVVRIYEARIYRFLLARCGNVQDAQELTQDTFVSAYQALRRFDVSKAFGPWLFMIARRKCIDRFRSKGPQSLGGPQPDFSGEWLVSSPQDTICDAEESAEIWAAAREHLSANQFEALWLRYVEDMSIECIASVMRKTQTHVKIILFRARKTLGAHLKPGSTRQDTRNAGPVKPQLQQNVI